MTGNELLNKTLAIINEDRADYLNIALECINTLLSDTFNINNIILEAAGDAPLAAIPTISALTDTIPYDDSLVRSAFPFGLASYLIYDDGDMGKVQYFHNMYVNACQDLSKALSGEVEDVYRYENI